MNRAILSQRISSILDDTQRLNNALYAMNTTDIQRYPDNYEVLSTDAALRAEQITCRLRHLIYATTRIKKSEYLTSAAAMQGIDIRQRDGVVEISVRLPALEEQQVLVRPGLVKGIIHIPLPGHPVKLLWGPGELDAVCGRAVGHQLFHGLPAVGRLVGPVFLLYLPASRPERIGQPPGRQLSRPHG